jgi:hypothetical protein
MRKFFNFGVGWVKSGKNGDFISCRANDKAESKYNNVRLQAVNEDGEVVDVTNFVVFYNANKERENQPDVRFCFSLED